VALPLTLGCDIEPLRGDFTIVEGVCCSVKSFGPDSQRRWGDGIDILLKSFVLRALRVLRGKIP
jgi:hypothetical protein